jgi:predicted glutamine amidotransferase
MCLILHGRAGDIRRLFDRRKGLVATIYTRNPDGVGVMARTRRRVDIARALPKSAEQARAFLRYHLGALEDDAEVAVHFRMATHGDVTLANTHPFGVGHGGWLMHNGMLDITDPDRPDWSDTALLAEALRGLERDQIVAPSFRRLLESLGQRFALFWPNQSLVIGQRLGVTLDGVWMSNTYAWAPQPTVRLKGWEKWLNRS